MIALTLMFASSKKKHADVQIIRKPSTNFQNISKSALLFLSEIE